MQYRISFALVVVSILFPGVVIAQEDSLWLPTAELSGSVFYSGSSTPHNEILGFEYESSSHTWAIQPAVAVFVAPYLAFGADFRYQQDYSKTEHFHPLEPFDRLSYSSTSALVVSIGPAYNFPLAKPLWVFIQMKVGLHWSATISGWGSMEKSAKWSRNQVVFPIVQGGLKLFVTPRSALVIHMQYERLTDAQTRMTRFGMGFATFL